MALLNQKVRIHDVEDCEAFVRAAIRDGRARLSPDEHEELLAEGLRIMVVLGKNYEPGRNGLDPATSRFSGYAAKYLRVKLGDAYHRLQQNTRLITGTDGVRRWRYDQKPVSLETVMETPNAIEKIKDLQVEDQYATDMEATLRVALERQWQQDRETTVKVGMMLGAGYALPDAVATLRIAPDEGLECVERIRKIAHKLEEET